MTTSTKKPKTNLVDDRLILGMQQHQFAHNTLKLAIKGGAAILGVEELDLQSWLASFHAVPVVVQLGILRLIKRYQLDPFCNELTLVQLKPDYWQPMITIDGWNKIVNQHAAFVGIQFQESGKLVDGVPEWMECAIYRNDRHYPITIREYYSEVSTEHSSWKAMPHRMLRYRTMQQSARLAFGISGSVVFDSLDHPCAQDRLQEKASTRAPKDANLEAKDFSKPVLTKRTDVLKELLGPHQTTSSS